MSEHLRTQIDQEFETFTRRNFESPTSCRNLDQIRFYVHELCLKIDELESRFHYVPAGAFSLLAQYNACQNNMSHVDFRDL
jgi:hypothetical protein